MRRGGRCIDVPYKVRETKAAFGFGASLPFFQGSAGTRSGIQAAGGDGGGVGGAPEGVQRVDDPVFRKWLYVEAEEGKRNYEDWICTWRGAGSTR